MGKTSSSFSLQASRLIFKPPGDISRTMRLNLLNHFPCFNTDRSLRVPPTISGSTIIIITSIFIQRER